MSKCFGSGSMREIARAAIIKMPIDPTRTGRSGYDDGELAREKSQMIGHQSIFFLFVLPPTAQPLREGFNSSALRVLFALLICLRDDAHKSQLAERIDMWRRRSSPAFRWSLWRRARRGGWGEEIFCCNWRYVNMWGEGSMCAPLDYKKSLSLAIWVLCIYPQQHLSSCTRENNTKL